jgi:hypothetical protein
MDLDLILQLASTVRLRMEAIQRRVQRKPGYGNADPLDLLRLVRSELDQIETELRKGN